MIILAQLLQKLIHFNVCRMCLWQSHVLSMQRAGYEQVLLGLIVFCCLNTAPSRYQKYCVWTTVKNPSIGWKRQKKRELFATQLLRFFSLPSSHKTMLYVILQRITNGWKWVLTFIYRRAAEIYIFLNVCLNRKSQEVNQLIQNNVNIDNLCNVQIFECS